MCSTVGIFSIFIACAAITPCSGSPCVVVICFSPWLRVCVCVTVWTGKIVVINPKIEYTRIWTPVLHVNVNAKSFVELSQAMWQCISPVPEDTQLYLLILHLHFFRNHSYLFCEAREKKKESYPFHIHMYHFQSLIVFTVLSQYSSDSRLVHLYNDDIAKIEMSSEENVTKRDGKKQEERTRRRWRKGAQTTQNMKRLKDKTGQIYYTSMNIKYCENAKYSRCNPNRKIYRNINMWACAYMLKVMQKSSSQP